MEEQIQAIRRLFTRVKSYVTFPGTRLHNYFMEAERLGIIQRKNVKGSQDVDGIDAAGKAVWTLTTNEIPL